jgi:hypothetical protein
MGRAIAVLVVAVATACSSSKSGTTEDAGSVPADGGSDAAAADAADVADAAPSGPVNNCKTFDDRTATGASRKITWGFPLSAADRCIAIKVGQSVTWAGNFMQYRVAASGGDKPNPIAAFDPDAPTVKFPAAGTFGFESPDAPALVGAIRVEP